MTFLTSIRAVFIVICLLILASTAWADSLQLRDGRHFDGQYVGGTAAVIGFFTDGSVQYFNTRDVLLVVFGAGATNSVNPLSQTPPTPMMKPMAGSPHRRIHHKKAVFPSPKRTTDKESQPSPRLIRANFPE